MQSAGSVGNLHALKSSKNSVPNYGMRNGLPPAGGHGFKRNSKEVMRSQPHNGTSRNGQASSSKGSAKMTPKVPSVA